MSGFRRRLIMAINTKPYDAEVEYIRGTGSQYVKFPVSAVAGDAFGVILVFENKTTSTPKLLLRDQRTSNYQFQIETYRRDTAPLRVIFGSMVGNNASGGALHAYDNEITTFELSTTKKRYNDTETAMNRPLTNSITSLTLLSSGFSADIYSMVVYKNGSNILDLKPVRKNGVGYLYDTISGAIVGTYTGSFSYGNDK